MSAELVYGDGVVPSMSPVGTFRTSWNVRSMVANGEKADMGRTVRFGSD